MLGKTIHQYQVVEQLGAGGMGEVYKARDTRLNRFVAIKVLPPGQAASDDRRRRFFQEAQASSALNHPNIITIYDIIVDGPVECIVMEYIPGKTLLELIPAGGMPPANVVRLGVQMAAALSTAHSHGIVHRDLKPGNVMVTDRGLVKILDFGLAKLTDPTPSGQSDETRTTLSGPLTVEGSILGTVSYMSPEQAQGKKVDARSDIFAFGAVLYEMATGRRAFEGENTLSTLTAVLRDEAPPIGKSVPGIPPEFDEIIHRCLRKLPEERYQTMAEVEEALASLRQRYDSGIFVQPSGAPTVAGAPTMAGEPTIAGAPAVVPPVPRPAVVAGPPPSEPVHRQDGKKRAPVALLAGLAVVLAAAAGGGWLLLKDKPGAESQSAATQPPRPADSGTILPIPSPIAPAGGEKPSPSKPAGSKADEIKAATGQPASTTEPRPAEPVPPTAPTAPAPMPARTVTIADGTPFTVTLSDDIPADAEESSALHFVAASDLKIGDAVVIAKGAPVTGAVLESKRKKMLGIGGKMTMRMLTARTVDGKTINLRATSGRRSDGPPRRQVEIPNASKSKEFAASKGTTYIAFIDGDVVVSVQP